VRKTSPDLVVERFGGDARAGEQLQLGQNRFDGTQFVERERKHIRALERAQRQMSAIRRMSAGETVIGAPDSSCVYQATLMPASSATSSRAQPGDAPPPKHRQVETFGRDCRAFA